MSKGGAHEIVPHRALAIYVAGGGDFIHVLYMIRLQVTAGQGESPQAFVQAAYAQGHQGHLAVSIEGLCKAPSG